jgi:hypothetical protein
MGAQATAQLSLAKDRNKDIKALVSLGQRDLIRRISGMEPGETEELLNRVGRIAPLAKKRSLSRKALIYAALRYLQERTQIRNPRAWVEGVAKKAEVEINGTGHDQEPVANYHPAANKAGAQSF